MIVEYPKFLTEDECNVLIGLGESGKLDHGKISSKKIGYRKAMVRWFGDDEIIQRVKLEVARLSQVPLEKQEEFHFVKYEQSGEYKEHYDGQGRQKTALIYLNQGYSGGETYFPNIRVDSLDVLEYPDTNEINIVLKYYLIIRLKVIR